MIRFQQVFRESDFAVTVDLPLTPTSTAATIRRDVAILDSVTDAVQIRDNPGGVPHISPLIVATICMQQGKDVVMHMNGRDRNRIALESDMLGAAAAGVTTLLMMRGEQIPESVTPRTRTVYEFGAKRLLRYANLIGGEPRLVPPPGFLLGSMVRAVRPGEKWRPREIELKADNGCKFLQTQPLLNTELMRAYMHKLVSEHVLKRVSVIVSVPLLSSAAQMDALLRKRAAVAIPRFRIEQVMNSPAPAAEGVAICAEVIREMKSIPGIAGVNIVGVDDCTTAAEAISLSEIR